MRAASDAIGPRRATEVKVTESAALEGGGLPQPGAGPPRSVEPRRGAGRGRDPEVLSAHKLKVNRRVLLAAFPQKLHDVPPRRWQLHGYRRVPR